MGPYYPPVALPLYSSHMQQTISQWSWSFLTVRSGTDPGEHCFRPRVVVSEKCAEGSFNQGRGSILP